MGATERTGEVEIEGRRLAWRSLGEGRPLLLINGYAATAADWDPTFLAELADGFEVICPDNRGLGRSELGDPGQLSVQAMALDLLALLDELRIESAALAGWSMGGFVAQATAALAAERVSGLALLSTDPGGADAIGAVPGIWDQLVDHGGTPREQAARLIALLFPPSLAPEIDRDFGELVAQARAALPVETLTAQERVMSDWHATDQPQPALDRAPVVIACGSEDVVIPPSNSRALAERYPSAGLEIFTGGGHAFMAQEPARLAELIKSTLHR